MLALRIGQEARTRLTRHVVTLEPDLADELDEKLRDLVQQWAHPADQAWWLADAFADLRSTAIAGAIVRMLDDWSESPIDGTPPP